jgi:two-component system sensor histidine kinase HydH
MTLSAMITRRAVLGIWLPVAVITAAHYLTGPELHYLHDIFRRLYYLPIVLGAFLFGSRGALAAVLVTTLAYLPHAFSTFLVMDPAHGIEKLLEIILYWAVGILAGLLVDRERRQRERAERLVEKLRRTLEQKQLMENELVRAGRLSALGELTAGLAHELKNPLASLKGTAQIFGDEIAPDSPRRRMLEMHLKEIDRLADILDRFLEFARPRPPDSVEIDLSAIVEETVELVKARAGQKRVSLEKSYGAESFLVRGDAQQLSQVVLNLLLNALQAVGEGGRIVLALHGERRERKEFICLEVSDDGPGVPPELRDRIFNPFFTTRSQGTGLGLAISARIVEAHGGLLEVGDSAMGGARFAVVLPLLPPPHAPGERR